LQTHEERGDRGHEYRSFSPVQGRFLEACHSFFCVFELAPVRGSGQMGFPRLEAHLCWVALYSRWGWADYPR
jgi:hypothetical protein